MPVEELVSELAEHRRDGDGSCAGELAVESLGAVTVGGDPQLVRRRVLVGVVAAVGVEVAGELRDERCPVLEAEPLGELDQFGLCSSEVVAVAGVRDPTEVFGMVPAELPVASGRSSTTGNQSVRRRAVRTRLWQRGREPW